MKTIFITEAVNFKMMLPPKEMERTEMLNCVMYLEERKHNLLIKRHGYKIEGGYITVFNVEASNINTIIDLINF